MKRRLIRWGTPAILVVILIIVASIVLTRWMNGSSDGIVHTGTPISQKQPVSTALAEPVLVTSTHYTTTLPGGFVIKRQADLSGSGPIASQFSANTNSEADQQVGITVGTLPSEGLAGIGSYHLRTSDAATYASFSPANLPSGAAAFRTIQGPAMVTVFWPHGELYAELTFSTDGKASVDSLLATYDQVLTNWEWK